jgi:hypothetical protein
MLKAWFYSYKLRQLSSFVITQLTIFIIKHIVL